MTVVWDPLFVLPNISLKTAIGCDIAAIAPPHDDRIVALAAKHPRFKQFLRRFADNFGEKFEPIVLIVNDAASPKFRDVEAVSDFRNLVAISAIVHGRSTALRHAGGSRLFFGESFAFYPWMLCRHNKLLVADTPAMRQMHDVSRLRGQSSPALSREELDASDIDRPLLHELMARWGRRHETNDPAWIDIALMRSLNMAYNASLMPAGPDATFYDVGRIVCLWVSAFEILAHPGGNGQTSLKKVFELIERTDWAVPESRSCAFETGGKTKVNRTLASSLYQRLYDCRNDFLHGNPIAASKLVVQPSGQNIFDLAAPLYRIALTAFLPLPHRVVRPSSADAIDIAAFVIESLNLSRPQENAEEALLAAAPSSTGRAARRNRFARPAR